MQNTTALLRIRWAAIGAALAVTLGAGGIGIVRATTSTGERAIYNAIEPCRLTDTRPTAPVGPRTSPIGPGETFVLSGWGDVGDCDLPSGTTALSLNVTAVNATQQTFLQFYPSDVSRPERGSSLNPGPGQPPTPNALTATLSESGEFTLYNFVGSVHIIIDVVGVFDDHNHDDRYYSKTQVDASIAALESQIADKPDASSVYTKAETDQLLADLDGEFLSSTTFGQSGVVFAFSLSADPGVFSDASWSFNEPGPEFAFDSLPLGNGRASFVWSNLPLPLSKPRIIVTSNDTPEKGSCAAVDMDVDYVAGTVSTTVECRTGDTATDMGFSLIFTV